MQCSRRRPAHRNSMCPAGLALHHPAGSRNAIRLGRVWLSNANWQAMVYFGDGGGNCTRAPPISIDPRSARNTLGRKSMEKVRSKQARVVKWEAIKNNPPTELKISPIVAIPHKSKAHRSILDLFFQLRLENGCFQGAVNDTTVERLSAFLEIFLLCVRLLGWTPSF